MRPSRTIAAVATALALGLLALCPAAWSYLTSTGAGSARAAVGTLAAPADVSASPTGTTVALSWTGSTAPGGGPVDGYYIERSDGTPAGSCASSASSLLAASPTSCTDTAVPPGTYTYTLVAVHRSWTASAAGTPVTVAAAAVVDHFDVTAPGSVTAGGAFTVTVTAKDATGSTATAYAGDMALVWSGPATASSGTTPTYPERATFTNGVGTASVSLVKAETTALSVTDGGVTGTTGAVVVAPAAASQLALAAPTAQVAGNPFDVTLTARDPFGNTATGYTGAKALVWTGPGTSPSGTTPVYPTSVTFANGAGTASVALFKAETTALTATHGAITGTSAAVLVDAGAASRLAWSGASVSTGTLSAPCLFTCTGSAVGNFGTFTARVSVTDGSGNTVRNLGAGHTVAVSTPSTGAGSGGAFTAPTAGASVTLTISTTGAATSTGTFTFKAQNGNWMADTFSAATASGTTFTTATATVAKQ